MYIYECCILYIYYEIYQYSKYPKAVNDNKSILQNKNEWFASHKIRNIYGANFYNLRFENQRIVLESCCKVKRLG